MIVYGRSVSQHINHREKETFFKELIITQGSVPLAMVRKRWAANDGGTRAPVLLVHGFGQNRYAWHLPSRSMVNYLARAGYDVFNVDLRGHGRSRGLGARACDRIDEYIEEDLPTAVEAALRLSGHHSLFLVGHSLGGLLSYAAAPGLAGAVRGIATLGSPYHFTAGSKSLSFLGLFLQAMSLSEMPLDPPLPVASIGRALSAMRRFAETPLYPVPVRGWRAGAVESHVLEEHLRLAFDRATIREFSTLFEWGKKKRFGERDYFGPFEKCDLPLLVMAGESDDLAPPDAVRPGFQRSRSREKTYRAFPLGHIDLLVGREAPLLTWPTLRTFLDAWAA